MVILVTGGVGYIPYASDEFTNWLGAAKQLFAAGGYERGRPFLIHPAYPVGWPLILAYPMVLLGRFDEGLAGAAPLVLQIGLAGMIFDLVRRALVRHLAMTRSAACLYGWLVVLLLLAAEAPGRLWPINLLIEPPQIAGYVALFLLVIHVLALETRQRTVWLLVGLVFVSCYLLKVTALVMLPALFVAVAAVAWTATGESGARFRETAFAIALAFVPAVAAILLWRQASPSQDCLATPFVLLRPDAVSGVMAAQAADLAGRYLAAVWDYVSGYKVPLTIAGVAGLLLAAKVQRLWIVSLAVLVFATLYFATLYWFHLTCFGPWYFEHLNSIPRYTRVVLRVVHTIGTLLLLLWLIQAVRQTALWPRFGFAMNRPFLTWVALIALSLLGWETWKLARTVDDLTTRVDQTISAQVTRIPREAARLRALAGTAFPRMPNVFLIDTQVNLDATQIALYHAMGTVSGGPPRHYRIAASAYCCGPAAADAAKRAQWEADMLPRLRQADVVWPSALDGAWQDLLARHIDDEACRRAITRYFLIPQEDGSGRLRCIAK